MLVPVLVFIGVMGCDTFDPGIQTDYLMQGTWFNEEGWAITITPSILTVNYNDEVVQSYWTEFSYIGDRGADAKKFSADITIYSYDKKVEIATFQADYSESATGKSLKISNFELADEYYYDKILRPPEGIYTSVAPEGGGPGPGGPITPPSDPEAFFNNATGHTTGIEAQNKGEFDTITGIVKLGQGMGGSSLLVIDLPGPTGGTGDVRITYACIVTSGLAAMIFTSGGWGDNLTSGTYQNLNTTEVTTITFPQSAFTAGATKIGFQPNAGDNDADSIISIKIIDVDMD